MLVDDLLASIAVQHHHEGVVPGDGAPHLKAVHQKQGDGHPVLPGTEEEKVL